MARVVLDAMRWLPSKGLKAPERLIPSTLITTPSHFFVRARSLLLPRRPFLISFLLLNMIGVPLASLAQAGGAWSEPVKLGPNVNSNLTNQFPYVTVNGQRLYFSSAIGAENEDVYLCHWDSLANEWGPKQLLPVTINTIERELSPCESPDGKYLWFTRWNASQGYDVFYSTWDSVAVEWGTAVNAGPNFNSSCHEWSVSISADSRRMFVAHDMRPGFLGCEGHVLWVSYWNDALGWWDSLVWMGDVVNRGSANAQACMSCDTSVIWIASGNSWPGVVKCGALEDLFSVSNNPPLWDSVANPGKPLNSFEAEGTVAISADGQRLYFSSWRDTLSNKLSIYVSEWQTGTGISQRKELGVNEVAIRATPNPFNGSTTISVAMRAPGNVAIDVYDLLGRLVSRIYSGTVPAGESGFDWDASLLATGVYFVRVSHAKGETHMKVLYLK